MGLFSIFKKKDDTGKYSRIKGLESMPPVYSQFGNDIYKSDAVQQAVRCICQEMKKLTPQHVKKEGENITSSVDDEIQAVLDSPNALMTTSDMLEKITWLLFFNYNAFVMPTWENNKLTGLYPILPKTIDFIQDNSGTFFVKLYFSNGYEGVIPYSDIIHIRYNFSVSEFMGGNEMGQPDNRPLLESLKLNDTLLKGVGKALNSSFAINGVVKYNTLIDGKKSEEALAELTTRLNNNESGFMPLDMKGEFIPFNRQVKLVDADTLKFIDEKILRHFGVPHAILTGDYTKVQYEAFFQKTLEPLIISMSQAFTKAIFSKRESFGFGHRIVFNHKELEFMTMDEKIRWLTLASNVGAITINEMRQVFGYAPTNDEFANKLVMSKNFGSVESVAEMDLNKTKNNNDKDIDKTPKTDDNSSEEQDDGE